jgi:hypothetical protein
VTKTRLLASILRKINSSTKDFIQDGTCQTTPQLVVVMRRTVIRLKLSTLVTTSTQNAEKMAGIFSFQLKRWSEIETIPMAETTYALRRRMPPTLRIRSTVSPWEAPREAGGIDLLSAITLC